MMTIKRKKKKRLGLCCYSNRWRNCKSIKFAGEQCVWLDLDRWVSGEPIGRWTLMMSLGQYRPLLALP